MGADVKVWWKTPWVRALYHAVLPVVDPVRALRGMRGYGWYLGDLYRYRRMPGAEAFRLADLYPQVHERTAETAVDAHYFYANGWAMRRILRRRPRRHVDIASQVVVANLLSAAIPVVFVDYRPLRARLDGLHSVAGSLLALPFRNGGVESLSCLHVAEHIGLGRYGDPLDPHGTARAASELARVLAPGGHLYFAVPVGCPRVCFNAHRIHAASRIREHFRDLALVEFSGVHDDGRFVEGAGLAEFETSEYACGMFLFRKEAPPTGRRGSGEDAF